MKKGLMLEEVQMPPDQTVRVVGLAVGRLANRTGKDAAARKIEIDIQTPDCLIERATLNLPWWKQPQSGLKQFVLVHVGSASQCAPLA